MHRISLLLAAAVAVPALAQPATFTPLGAYGSGIGEIPNSYATALSANGAVVTGSARVIEPFHWIVVNVPLRWTAATGWQEIPATGWGSGTAVSRDGTVIAGSTWQGLAVIFQDGFVIYGLTNPTIVNGTGFQGLSADGLIAVGWRAPETYVPRDPIAFTAAGGIRPLGHLPGATDGSASAVSANGSVIVGSDGSPTPEQAFIWSDAQGIRGLGFLPGAPSAAHSRALAVSADGRAVVGVSTNADGVDQGFLWRAESGMVPFRLLTGYTRGSALAVSADGSVVVGDNSNTTGSIAYYWDRARGRRNLRQFLISQGATGLTGWTLTRATAISPDGTFIVGQGTDPQGRSQAWLAHLPQFCYADCDGSGSALNVSDFVCFQTRFAAADAYADCNQDGGINVLDFACFQAAFAAGCP